MYRKFSLFFCWLFGFQALANPLIDAQHMARLLDKTVYEPVKKRIVFIPKHKMGDVPSVDFDPFMEDMAEHGGGDTADRDSGYLKTPQIRALHGACRRILGLFAEATDTDQLFKIPKDASGTPLPYGLLRRDAYDALGEFVGAYEGLKSHIDFRTLFEYYKNNQDFYDIMESHGFQSLFFGATDVFHEETMDEEGARDVAVGAYGGAGKSTLGLIKVAFTPPSFKRIDYPIDASTELGDYRAIQWANFGILHENTADTQGWTIGRHDNFYGPHGMPLPYGILYDGYGFKINMLPLSHGLDLQRLWAFQKRCAERDGSTTPLTRTLTFIQRINKELPTSGLHIPVLSSIRDSFTLFRTKYFNVFAEFSTDNLIDYMLAYGAMPPQLLLAFASFGHAEKLMTELAERKISLIAMISRDTDGCSEFVTHFEGLYDTVMQQLQAIQDQKLHLPSGERVAPYDYSAWRTLFTGNDATGGGASGGSGPEGAHTGPAIPPWITGLELIKVGMHADDSSSDCPAHVRSDESKYGKFYGPGLPSFGGQEYEPREGFAGFASKETAHVVHGTVRSPGSDHGRDHGGAIRSAGSAAVDAGADAAPTAMASDSTETLGRASASRTSMMAAGSATAACPVHPQRGRPAPPPPPALSGVTSRGPRAAPPPALGGVKARGSRGLAREKATKRRASAARSKRAAQARRRDMGK